MKRRIHRRTETQGHGLRFDIDTDSQRSAERNIDQKSANEDSRLSQFELFLDNHTLNGNQLSLLCLHKGVIKRCTFIWARAYRLIV
ncbi:hypothetical protein M3Y96_00899700 [Aphelenchoides besseyi]|nr:hypothetical protein M3Y96_00899700 [Aphelenchoides besseyi]